MSYEHIMYEKQGPIGYITLNRPEKMNALSTSPGGLLEEWEEACNDAKQDQTIRVVIIKGAGRCFSAGYDISVDRGTMGAPIDEARYDYMANHVGRYFRVLWENPKVFIAQVQKKKIARRSNVGASNAYSLQLGDFQISSGAVAD